LGANGAPVDWNAAKLRFVIQHPLGKLAYVFDKDNSAKIRAWFAPVAQPVTV